MKSDIEIARSTELMKIKQIAQNYGIPTDQVHHYGSYMAKVSEALIDEEKVKQSNLILVTAITPTKAGIGKTTVSIGLALGLNRIGRNFLRLARAFDRTVFRNEGRGSRRRIRSGAPDGENQPAFHGRFPRHYFGA